MGCPIHIWLPLMGVAAPFVRIARDRIRAFRSVRGKAAAEAEPPRELKRWAPVGAPPADAPERPS